MAQINLGDGYFSAYASAADTQTITVTGSTFSWSPLSLTGTYFYMPYGVAGTRTLINLRVAMPKTSGTVTFSITSNASASTANGGWSGAVSWPSSAAKTYNTSDFFNANNSTTRSVTGRTYATANNTTCLNATTSQGSAYSYAQSEQTLTTINITLDAPPTFTASNISYDTAYVYSGLTTASATISNSTAYYGGSISSVAFTIGSQTVTSSGDGTLSILLNAGGTFTPTVTVTDSRGQTTTQSLDPITVNTYTAPSVSFDVDRTDSTGTPDDEGTYGFIEATLTFADVVADAVAPSVVLTDDTGSQSTPTVTWYTTSAMTTTVTWPNVSSGDTVYGLFSGLSTQHSYQVSVRPRDSQGTGTAITQMLSAAFYTIDFYAGGHGIAFGQPATTTGFECDMVTTFHDTVDVEGDLTAGADVFIELPNYTTSGDIDKDIYDAIVALGWDSDVLTN